MAVGAVRQMRGCPAARDAYLYILDPWSGCGGQFGFELRIRPMTMPSKALVYQAQSRHFRVPYSTNIGRNWVKFNHDLKRLSEDPIKRKVTLMRGHVKYSIKYNLGDLIEDIQKYNREVAKGSIKNNGHDLTVFNFSYLSRSEPVVTFGSREIQFYGTIWSQEIQIEGTGLIKFMLSSSYEAGRAK